MYKKATSIIDLWLGIFQRELKMLAAFAILKKFLTKHAMGAACIYSTKHLVVFYVGSDGLYTNK